MEQRAHLAQRWQWRRDLETFSDQFGGSEWPTPGVITLKAGTRYYMESLHTEGGGGDSVGATLIMEGEADPVDGSAPKLTGSLIATFIDPTGASVTIGTQPKNTTQQEGRKAKLTVAANGTSLYGSTVSYQWQSAPKGGSTFTDIAGATLSAYTTPVLALADDGKQYRVKTSVPAASTLSDIAVVTVVPDTFPPVATAGALPGAATGVAEIGVGFDEPIDNATGSVAANYSVSAGTITGFTWYPNSQSALLKVTGFGASGSVTVKNVADAKGNKITSVDLPVTVSTKQKWGVVGAGELGLGNWVVPVAANGFDVYSDSIGEWGTYDEATFVYESVKGDFDKKLRVEYQDLSSQWGRAGIIVRDVLNFGATRDEQTGDGAGSGTAGRYQKCHVNPVGPTMTGPGTAGNGSWEGNRRLTTGAATTSAGGGGVPLYPNAWCRIQRVGQTFTIFRSDDGETWTSMGSSTFDPAMPDTVFVGPEFAPENGNVTNESDRKTWLAKFRDYGDTFAAVGPTLSYAKTASNMTLTFTGGLQSADSVKGPWADVTGASPQTVTFTGAQKFFRAVSK